MQSTACYRELEREPFDDLDRESLARDIASLREDVCSVSDDIRRVLEENAALKQELGRLRNRRQQNRSLDELKRLKGELDMMIGLQDSTSRNGGDRDRSPREAPTDQRGVRQADWLKKMMMFMMLSEMV